MARLRLVTFNIAHGRGLNPIQGLTPPRMVRYNLLNIAKLLHKVKADVVALQEIDQKSWWSGNFDHLKYLHLHAHFPHWVHGLTNNNDGLLSLKYGNGLLSQLPIFAAESVVFGRKRVGEKGFLYVELNAGGKIVPLITLHLHYRSRVQRLRQLEHLVRWLKACEKERGRFWYSAPIVCGDFNASQGVGDATAELQERMKDFSFYRVFPRAEKTFPSPWPTRTLDFVFLPSDCHRITATVLKSYLSDHLPVMVEFDL